MVAYKEVDIEDFIWKSISGGDLQSRRLHISNAMYYRQPNVPGCGIMDIVSVSFEKLIDTDYSQKFVTIYIYELKRGTINCAHVGQLMRYVNTLKSNSGRIKSEFKIPNDYKVVVSGILIGDDIEKDAYHLVSSIDEVCAYLFKLSFDKGLIFNFMRNKPEYHTADFSQLPKITFEEIARASYPMIQNYKMSEEEADSLPF